MQLQPVAPGLLLEDFCMKYLPLQLKLTVFKTFKHSIINRIMKQLYSLCFTYKLNTVYNSSERNTFYFKRSLIINPYHYWFESDEKFVNALNKFKIHYVDGKMYHSGKDVFILNINGYSKFNLYREAYFSDT